MEKAGQRAEPELVKLSAFGGRQNRLIVDAEGEC